MQHCMLFSLSFSPFFLNILAKPKNNFVAVVYFDLQTGALHLVCWSNIAFSHFSSFSPILRGKSGKRENTSKNKKIRFSVSLFPSMSQPLKSTPTTHQPQRPVALNRAPSLLLLDSLTTCPGRVTRQLLFDVTESVLLASLL